MSKIGGLYLPQNNMWLLQVRSTTFIRKIGTQCIADIPLWSVDLHQMYQPTVPGIEEPSRLRSLDRRDRPHTAATADALSGRLPSTRRRPVKLINSIPCPL